MKIKKKSESKKILVPYSPNSFIEKDKMNLFDGGYLFLQKIYYDLELDKTCHKISMKYKFGYNLNHIIFSKLYPYLFQKTVN